MAGASTLRWSASGPPSRSPQRSPSPKRAPWSASSACLTAARLSLRHSFGTLGWRGGPAPARLYIPELMQDVLDGRMNPGLVFNYETDLDGTPDAYKAMDERVAIKSLIRVGSL